MNKKVLALSTAAALISVGTLGAVGTKLAMKPSAVAKAFYGPTGDTFRLWVDRNGHYQRGYDWVIKTPDGTLYYPKQYVQFWGNAYFPYYDLPVSIINETDDTDFSFIVKESNSSTFESVEIPVDYKSGDNSKCYTMQYTQSTNTWSFTRDYKLTQGFLNADGIKAILEAYYSCSPNKDNGYGNFKEVCSTWFWNQVEGGVYGYDNFGSVAMNDYSATSDYEDGEKNLTTDAWTKINFMLGLANTL